MAKYNKKFCKQIIGFFDIEPYREVEETYTYKDGSTKTTTKLIANDLRFLRDFAKHIGVSTKTIWQWTKKYPAFAEAHELAKECQKEILIKNGLQGLYQPAFTIFTMKNICGWRDAKGLELTGEDGSPLKIVLKWPENGDEGGNT